ncbi:hypothetical protein FJZ55_00010 [Candidatus Woesearchaeota archaeon]|nr:hypothetical protein [Candidatus Woesearchaeota archaeon]
MSSYLKTSIKKSFAESFLSELERNENQYLFFIGKGTPWQNEFSPDLYVDSVGSEFSVMNNIIGYKKINPDDIIFAISRYEWVTGTVYNQYSDSEDLFDDTNPKIFYVITDQNNIYKCLSNNNNSPSTVRPDQTIVSPFGTSDGYIWKFLGTAKESNLPFELTDYIPVEIAHHANDTETVNQYNTQIQAVNSSITRVDLSDSGFTGVSAGVYNQTITSSVLGLDSGTYYTISVGNFSTITNTKKKVIITDSISRQRINLRSGGSLQNYIGYVMRVDKSQVNGSQVNNYGIITAVTSTENDIDFTVENDAVDFVVTPTTGSQFSSVEITPHIRAVGDGYGLISKPNMNNSKQISSVTVVNSGKNYSNITLDIPTTKTSTSVHPILTGVLSPKNGHGSNILSELGTQDILIIVEISEEDSEKIVGSPESSYRQFGIIKNPVLSNGSREIAGKSNLYFRDITLFPNSGTDLSLDSIAFPSTGTSFIFGKETFSCARVVGIKSTRNSSNNNFLVVRTVSSHQNFVTRLDRPNNYSVQFSAAPAGNFTVGERIQQIVPAGTVIGGVGGISYGYALQSFGTVVFHSGNVADVIFDSGSLFVSGYMVEGELSGVTATVSSISPKYGEDVSVAYYPSGSQSYAFLNDVSSQQNLYRIVEVGSPYFETGSAPAFRGLHVLDIATSVSGVTGLLDTTTTPLTPNSFSVGSMVVQGSTSSSYFSYATGRVYKWDFVNPSYGRLYLTGVNGNFKNVEVDGITGSVLQGFIVSSVSLPEIDRTSGEIIYIDNIRQIKRTIGQEEEFRLRLGF